MLQNKAVFACLVHGLCERPWRNGIGVGLLGLSLRVISALCWLALANSRRSSFMFHHPLSHLQFLPSFTQLFADFLRFDAIF